MRFTATTLAIASLLLPAVASAQASSDWVHFSNFVHTQGQEKRITLVYVNTGTLAKGTALLLGNQVVRAPETRIAETRSVTYPQAIFDQLQLSAGALGLEQSSDDRRFSAANSGFFSTGAKSPSLNEAQKTEISQLQAARISSDTTIDYFDCTGGQSMPFSGSAAPTQDILMTVIQRKDPEETQYRTRVAASKQRSVRKQIKNDGQISDADVLTELGFKKIASDSGSDGHMKFICDLPVSQTTFWNDNQFSANSWPMAETRQSRRWARRIAENYPSKAIKLNLTGQVRYIVVVGGNGRVDDCFITQSSGHELLDTQTCKLVTRYARFDSPELLDAPLALWKGLINWTLNH